MRADGIILADVEDIKKYAFGGSAPPGSASLAGDLGQMQKALIARLLQSTSPGSTRNKAGSLAEQVQYLIDVIDNTVAPGDAASPTGSIAAMLKTLVAAPGAPPRSVYSSFSAEAIGVEIAIISTVANLSAAATITQNLAYFCPLYLPGAFAVKRFLWRNGATVNGNVTCALFSSAGVLQGTRTASTAMAGASTLQAAAPSGGDFTVQAGAYFLVFASDSASATFVTAQTTAGDLRMMGVQEQAADYALASPATLVAHSTDAKLPWVAVSTLTTN